MKIRIQCDNCGKTVWREKGEVNRSRRLDRPQYCGQQCMGKASKPYRDGLLVSEYIPRRYADELSPFREYLRRMNQRKHEVTVTLWDLKEQWDQQDGKCLFTGWDLKLARSTYERVPAYLPDGASVDRIDSTQGYIPGNIQWVATIANYCKNGWANQAVIDFARAVVQTHGSQDPKPL